MVNDIKMYKCTDCKHLGEVSDRRKSNAISKEKMYACYCVVVDALVPESVINKEMICNFFKPKEK